MKRVLMYPTVKSFGESESGIRRVVEAYEKYLPKYGWQVTDDEENFDISAVHAGTASRQPDVAHTHGLYWSGDHAMEPWTWKANEQVLDGVRRAKQVTVPSTWVREVFQRDMRFSPHVIPHGIDWWDYEPQYSGNYVLWNKNRHADVCDPAPVGVLASRAKDVFFLSTFSNSRASNIQVTGVLPHDKMLNALTGCSVYLATTKETFGIGILEAMALGKPVLGFAHGGILDLVSHRINGYLASPGDYDDLEQGLRFCLENAVELGQNSRDLVKRFTWDAAVEQLAEVYNACLVEEPATCDIIIPVFNKPPEILARAISSALSQTKYLGSVIVVDDGSKPELSEQYGSICDKMEVLFTKKENGGVATARNLGISVSTAEYVSALDADDAIHEDFLLACVPELEADRGLGIAYTGIWAIDKDGGQGLTSWPGEYNYDRQLKRQNQVPTCCVFRREMWERLGGYKQRYAPTGAGAEDAEFWLRAGAYGYGAKKVTDAGMFIYSLGQGHTSQGGYREVDWTAWHPWTRDQAHPMASMATPSRFSHPVRSYDQPSVSVIIPVGPGHEEMLVDALDSLEAQTFRRWEAVVADDSHDGIPDWILRAYPYIRLVKTGGGKGAGYARNRAVERSRGPMISFLDSDDYLHPEFLEKTLDTWSKTGNIAYTDYLGIARVDNPDQLAKNIKVVSREPDGTTVLAYKAADYDCVKAMRQPENPPYLWTNVNVLMPRRWFDEVGGFDETLPSWEDYLLFLQLAWSGKCFQRIPEPLMTYRFSSGTRRDKGQEYWNELIEYIKQKKGDIKTMAKCSSCPGNKSVVPPAMAARNNLVQGSSTPSEDSDMVMIRYISPNRGQHPVRGQYTKTWYGHRAGGGQESFLVDKRDIKLQPHLFQVLSEQRPDQTLTEPSPEPVQDFDAEAYLAKIRSKWQPDQELDLQTLPGVTDSIARNMRNSGLVTKAAILEAGAENLAGAVKGLGQIKAEMIIAFLEGQDE